jgi:exosortase A
VKLDTQFEPARLAGAGTRPDAAWVAAGIAFAAILVLHWRTVADMAAIWTRSETFTHGYLVLPISLWLVWRERAALAALAPRPWLPALLAVAGSGFLWLLADLASAGSPAQFAVVLMLQAAIVAILGRQVARAMLFPLAFLFFAVPAGEFLVPKLMDATADVTVLALQATGVPVYREGNHFAIPSGHWSVVAACSGIRYLIASMMAGSLFAWLMYRTAWKRVAFFAVSIAVPIVANWLRAYLIVMIGHLSGNKYAAGVDHLIYGWIFFGIVIAIMFWIGSWWREDDVPAERAGPAAPPTAAASPARPATPRFAAAALATIFAAGLWLPLGHWIDAAASTAPPGPLAVAPANGWRAAEDRARDWKPDFQGMRTEYQGRFAKDGREVGLYLAYYSHQVQDHELVNSQNALVSAKDPGWIEVARGSAALEWGGERVDARRADLRGAAGRLRVAHFYWIGGRLTSSDPLAKLLLAFQRLAFRDDDSAAIVLYTPGDDSGRAAEETLERFAREMGGAVDRALERASRRGG